MQSVSEHCRCARGLEFVAFKSLAQRFVMQRAGLRAASLQATQVQSLTTVGA